MITEINDKQIADYQENGFLVYNGFINKNMEYFIKINAC